ncbi:MAG TPA: M23 family metallopeptidase [Gaiellaceae bacterium]|nr:M23 family metallopeptidase [Gaiellaceae bacterium]
MQVWQRHRSLLLLVTALAAASLVGPAVASAWTWPVDGPVLRGFLFSEDTPLAPGQHRGIDIQGALGDQVVAPVGGTVTFVGRVAANGLTVTIETSDGYIVTLLHLGEALVRRGDAVAEGQPVAIVGSSGVPEYTVPYVQLGVRLSMDPEGYLDPQVFLPPLAPPSTPAAPAPGTQPAPVAPPAAATPPPAVAPPTPADQAVPRNTLPVAGIPERPLSQPQARRVAAPTPAPAAVAATPDPSMSAVAPADASPVVARHPLDAVSHSSFAASPRHPAAAPQPAPRAVLAATPATSWVRPLDPVTLLASAGAPHAGRGSAVPRRDVLVLLLALVAAVGLAACKFAARAARIIGADALLPDDADLLREREPAHRARVHDDRGRRAHPSPQAAR